MAATSAPDPAPAGRLRVALVQTASSLDPEVNRRRLDEAGELAGAADLVVFPEAFARDFGKPGSDLSSYAEPLDGPFVTRLREVSDTHDVAILAGMFERSENDGPGERSENVRGRPWNTLVLADRGTLTTYRKIHLYDSFGYRESDVLDGGEPTPVVVDVRGAAVGLMTCYDLRFPEMARALVDAGAEVIAVPAAWAAGPRKRLHWSTLLRARAIENLCFVVAAAQSAPRYTGFSAAYSPYGDELGRADADEALLTVGLDLADVARARDDNPSLQNRRL